MNRPGWNPSAVRTAAARFAMLPMIAIGTVWGTSAALAQENAVVPPPASFPLANTLPEAPGVAVAETAPAPGIAPVAAAPALPDNVQVVRFQGPPGLRVEVLGPSPENAPAGDGQGLITVGLKVGVPYRLRVTNLPERPEAEIFPVIEVVGHLHRPQGIDPGKYPVRVVFDEDDFVDVADRGRLVTQVIYLEDPEQALPLTLPKDKIPIVTISPSEEPLKVASALGRVMAIVRMGGRRPTQEELNVESLGLSGPPSGAPCPFTATDGSPCKVVCGPVRGTPPPAGKRWVPKDEFLCDGGDQGSKTSIAGLGNLRGIDPRDAVIKFNTGDEERVLPTNMVCVYAPRFSEVRVSVGPNESLNVQTPVRVKYLEKSTMEAAKQGANRYTQNQAAEAARVRARASGLASRVRAGTHSDLVILSGYDLPVHIAGNVKVQGTEKAKGRQKVGGVQDRLHLVGINLAESAVITGIVEGAGETVMSWTPRETVGVEVPPNKPGLAVIKRVSATEAEAGDKLTYVIQYRNMGNTPIRAVSIIDSLLPRLGYVKGSAQGPKGTIFSAEENRVGSTELRWEIPGTIAPGAEGYVTFDAIVR